MMTWDHRLFSTPCYNAPPPHQTGRHLENPEHVPVGLHLAAVQLDSIMKIVTIVYGAAKPLPLVTFSQIV